MLCLGNYLQQALRKIGKENIVHNCVFNIEWVTDAAEKELAKSRLTSRGGSVDGTTVGGRRVRVSYLVFCYSKKLSIIYFLALFINDINNQNSRLFFLWVNDICKSIFTIMCFLEYLLKY